MLKLLQRISTGPALRTAVVLAIVSGSWAEDLSADTVILFDGTRHEGAVLSVDAGSVTIQTSGGKLRMDRDEVESIHFTPPAPSLKVEIRNVQADDALDVLLDDEVVISGARAGGAWIDLTPKLKDGNNPLRLRIRNGRGVWAYDVSLRINGQMTRLSCGRPNDLDDPCQCCGKTGRETGWIDDLPPVWIHVDRETGSAEVLP